MAIVVTKLGTGQEIDGQNFSIVIGVIPEGLLVAATAANAEIVWVRWHYSGLGAYEDLFRDVIANNAGNVTTQIWSRPNAHAGTSASAYIQIGSWPQPGAAATIYTATGIATILPLDKTSTGIGTGTVANSGSSGTLSQADELIIGAIGMEEEIDEKGTWTDDASHVYDSDYEQDACADLGGAKSSTICSVAEIVSATTAQIAEMTGTLGNDWAACIATYKGVGGAAYYHGLKVQGEGELALCDAGIHPLRTRKGGVTYGVELVALDDPNASRVRVKTPAGIKAIRGYT